MAEITKLKTDIVFKKFFTDKNHEGLLKSFIAAVLDAEESEINDIVISNTEITPDEIDGKFTRFDINMMLSKMNVNIEIQVNNEGDFRERSLYYWSQNYGGQLKKGETYRRIKPTIAVNIIDFSLFKTSDYHSVFTVADLEHNEILTDKCRLHYLELPKLDKLIDKNDKLKLWMQLIDAESEEDLEKLKDTEVPEMREGVRVIYGYSANEEMRLLAQRREKAVRDEMSALENARDEGMAIGMEKGRASGLAEGRASGLAEGRASGLAEGMEKAISEMAEKMRLHGISEDDIKRITGLDNVN